MFAIAKYSARFLLFAFLLICYPELTPAQFDQVLNIPPDKLPEVVEERTQVNLFAGGVIPDNYVLGNTSDETELNVFGGTIGNEFTTKVDDVTIESGTVGDSFCIIPQDLRSPTARLVAMAGLAGLERGTQSMAAFMEATSRCKM